MGCRRGKVVRVSQIDFRENQSGAPLRRILGTSFGLAICIGGAVGVGILRTPGTIAGQISFVRLALILWAAGGLYALAGANTLAELATALPEVGGGYVYTKRAYGDFLGFSGGLNDFVLSCCGAAYSSIAASEIAGTLIPALSTRVNLGALIILAIVAAINWIGLRAGELSQKLISFAKVAGLLMLAAGCFWIGAGQSYHAPDLFASATHKPLGAAAIALTFAAIMETYAGWNSPVYFSEENKNPTRTIPRGLFLGVAAIAVVYVLVNAGLFYALPVETLAQSKLPAADAATLMLGATGGRAIAVLALLAIVGIINAQILYVPRVLFAMSRDGFLPATLMKLNRGGTPNIALALTALVIGAFAVSGSFEALLAIAAFLGIAGDTVIYVSLFVLRRREPALPRPFRARLYPIVPGLVVLGGIALLTLYVVGNPLNSLASLAILASFYPLFLISRKMRRVMADSDNITFTPPDF